MIRIMNKGWMFLALSAILAVGCASESTSEATESGVAAKNEEVAEKAVKEVNSLGNEVKSKAAETPERNDPKTIMSFKEMDYDFGSIAQDTENEYIFKFTNTGTNPLIIYTAKGSCGCTVPEYPKAPVAPGEEGEIRVVYKPGKQKNKQTKYVTITANTEPEQTKLKITAEVQAPEGEG